MGMKGGGDGVGSAFFGLGNGGNEMFWRGVGDKRRKK